MEKVLQKTMSIAEAMEIAKERGTSDLPLKALCEVIFEKEIEEAKNSESFIFKKVSFEMEMVGMNNTFTAYINSTKKKK